jgi:hypothetical protein
MAKDRKDRESSDPFVSGFQDDYIAPGFRRRNVNYQEDEQDERLEEMQELIDDLEERDNG